MQELAEAVRKGLSEGQPAVVGRVVDVKGFSTLPVDEMIAISATGTQVGDLLGRPGRERLAPAAAELLGGDEGLRSVSVSIHGKEVEEVGLACGGQAEVLLQTTRSIPARFWELLADRAPAALITRIEGPSAGPGAIVVDREGQAWGTVDGDTAGLVSEAVGLLAAGRSARQRVEDQAGVALVEAWVPSPRLVIVGTGEMVDAIVAQVGLLGWDARATSAAGEVDGLLDWAGTTSALVVLSHDPHVDAPALATGLARGAPYVGAMGSRGTQSRRVERLRADGVADADIERIHRPIGLDLGGRRAPEVALAIAAEILAAHCGRDGGSLRNRTGPIHG